MQICGDILENNVSALTEDLLPGTLGNPSIMLSAQEIQMAHPTRVTSSLHCFRTSRAPCAEARGQAPLLLVAWLFVTQCFPDAGQDSALSQLLLSLL